MLSMSSRYLSNVTFLHPLPGIRRIDNILVDPSNNINIITIIRQITNYGLIFNMLARDRSLRPKCTDKFLLFWYSCYHLTTCEKGFNLSSKLEVTTSRSLLYIAKSTGPDSINFDKTLWSCYHVLAYLTIVIDFSHSYCRRFFCLHINLGVKQAYWRWWLYVSPNRLLCT